MKKSSFLSLLFVLFLNYCSVGDDLIDDYREPEIIIENTSNIPTELTILTQYQFSANFFNDVGELKKELITWESSDLEVIKINANGLATAVGEGSATIIVAAQNNNPNTDNPRITKEVTTITIVTIPEVLSITNPLNLLVIGEETVFIPRYFNNTGIEDASVALEWSSSDPAVATINNSGKATAIREGTTTITVKTVNNSVSISFLLEVKEIVSAIRIDNPIEDLKIGKTHQYEFSYFDENGDINTTNPILLESSNTAIATINNGLVTAISPGNTTITASTVENGRTILSTTMINVSNNTLTINDIERLAVNENHQYTVFFEGTTAITWASSDVSKATINSNGEVTAISEGTVTITATTIEGGTTIIDQTDLEITSFPSKSGTLSGSYQLSGTVVLTITSLQFTNFVVTAPDTHIYLTNNPSSIANGLKASVSNVTTNASFSLALNDININNYSYVVVVCQRAGNLIFGSAELN